jgi:DNA polymerase III subunit chi
VTAPQPSAPPRVDFYVLPGTDERPRLKVGCRIAERAYLAGERVFVWLDVPHALERFDELLWTFADRAFVPHEIFQTEAQWQDTPVLVSCDPQPQQSYGVLINLGNAIPASAAHAASVAEVIDAHEERRQAGRARFRQYRDRGVTPATHNMATEDADL